MPRPKGFNNDNVLHAAMGAFRQHGYGGTSIKMLEQATGLTSGSLYNSFGGKDEIFRQALAHYNKAVVQQRIHDHLEAKPPHDGILSLFLSLLDQDKDQPFGCLLTNSAVEFGAGASVANAGVQQGFKLLEDGFQAALDRMPEVQNTSPAKSYEHTAARLLAFYQGILVLIRFGQPKAPLRSLIHTEIQQLTGVNL